MIGKIYYLLATIFKRIEMSEEGEITILTHATTRSNSLRTTFPIGLARQFKLKEGDKLRWMLRVENDKLIIIIEPVKVSNSE
jgi:hypothetical protein